MKPVKQTIIYNEHTEGNGDCVTACYASILELPLWMVPQWHHMYGRPDYMKRQQEWLRTMFDMEEVSIHLGSLGQVLDEDDQEDYDNLPEFYIAIGPTVRGGHHAVVYSNGKLVHDPHSSDLGLTKVIEVRYFRPLGNEVDYVPKLAEQVQRMICSATEIVGKDEIDLESFVVGYKIKTGALHTMLGLLQSAGHPITVPSNLPKEIE